MTQLSNVQGKTAKYISSSAYANVATWTNNGGAGHAASVGDFVRPTGVSNGITMTQANPGVFTWRDNGGSALTHNFQSGDRLVFTNNGDTLPGGLAFNTTYYVTSPSGSTFNLSATFGGSNINTTSGSNAGTHIATCLNERYACCYICTVAGTGATSLEPVWPSHFDSSGTRGNTITDGTITWQEATGVAMLNGDLTNTPNWTQGGFPGFQAYGQVITDNAQTHVFICTTNNVAAAGSEPTWNTSAVGNSTTDGSQHWTYLGTVTTWQGKKWSSPFRTVQDACSGGWADGTNGGANLFFVGNNHHGLIGSRSLSWHNSTTRGTTNQPMQVTCVNESGSVPPVYADLATTAIEEYYGTSGADLQPFMKMYGVEIRQSNTATTNGCWLGYTAKSYFEKCLFNHMGTSGNPAAWTSYQGVELKNCQFKGGVAGWHILLNSGTFYWHNDDGTTAFSGGTYPTDLFWCGGGAGVIEGVDLSASTGDIITANNNSSTLDLTLRNCKVPNAALASIANFNYSPVQRFRAINCNNGAYFNHCEVYDYMGAMTTDHASYAASGASIQSSGYSWKVTTQYANDAEPWESLPISAYNVNISSTVTATVYGCCIGTLPTNDQVWLEADYLGSTGSPLASGISGRCLRLDTPVTLTADTTNWTGGVAARQNSHGYSLKDEIVPTGDSGRVYVCTTAGTSASSEGTLYSTAAGDNNVVTDGTAHFTSQNRFKLTLSITSYPAVTGPINAVIRISDSNLGTTASKTYWFDPLLNLS